jgi:hypothetical protein
LQRCKSGFAIDASLCVSFSLAERDSKQSTRTDVPSW